MCTMRCRYISQTVCFSTIAPGLFNAKAIWAQINSSKNVIEFRIWEIKQLAVQFIDPEMSNFSVAASTSGDGFCKKCLKNGPLMGEVEFENFF